MSIPPASKNGNEGDDYEWQGHEGQQHVGNKNREINPRDYSGVAGRFLANVRVINYVANEKKCGANDGRDHARHMALPDVAANPKPARRNKNRAQRVERGVDRG